MHHKALVQHYCKSVQRGGSERGLAGLSKIPVVSSLRFWSPAPVVWSVRPSGSADPSAGGSRSAAGKMPAGAGEETLVIHFRNRTQPHKVQWVKERMALSVWRWAFARDLFAVILGELGNTDSCLTSWKHKPEVAKCCPDSLWVRTDGIRLCRHVQCAWLPQMKS